MTGIDGRGPTAGRSRSWRWVRRGLAVGVVGLAVILLWLLTWPPTAPPDRADAVIVLAGSSARLDRGLELVEAGVAPTIAISNGNDPGWVRGNALCERPQDFEVVCFRPRPQTTAGEARVIARLADEEGWQHVAIVTSPWHVTRARLLVGQCTAAAVAMVAHDLEARERLRPSSLAHETLGLLAGLTIDRAC